jgi:hypothetical protein
MPARAAARFRIAPIESRLSLRFETSVAFTLEVYSQVLPHMQETAAMKVEALLFAV